MSELAKVQEGQHESHTSPTSNDEEEIDENGQYMLFLPLFFVEVVTNESEEHRTHLFVAVEADETVDGIEMCPPFPFPLSVIISVEIVAGDQFIQHIQRSLHFVNVDPTLGEDETDGTVE